MRLNMSSGKVVLISIFFIIYFKCLGQENVDTLFQILENPISEVSPEKIDELNSLSFSIANSYPEISKRLAQKSLKVALKINYGKGAAGALNLTGNAEWTQGNYAEALKFYFRARDKYLEIEDSIGFATSLMNIGNLYGDLFELNGDPVVHRKGLINAFEALRIYTEENNKYRIAMVANNIGTIYLSTDQTDSALIYFKKALAIREELNDLPGLSSTYNNIGIVYKRLSKIDIALDYYQKSLEIKMGLNDLNGLALNFLNIGNIHSLKGEFKKASDNYREGLGYAKSVNSKKWQSALYHELYELEKQRGDFRAALEQQQNYFDTKLAMLDKQKGSEIKNLEIGHKLKEREKELALKSKDVQVLTQNQKMQSLIRNILLVGMVVIVGIGLAIFQQKKQIEKKNGQLKQQNEEISRQGKLLEDQRDVCIGERENKEKLLNKIELLFGQQVSKEVVKELVKKDDFEPSKHFHVTVLFLDIRDFTSYADTRPPAEVAAFQNSIFGELILIIRKHHGIINQILGDGIMATFGAPIKRKNHVIDGFNAGLEMLQKTKELVAKKVIPQIKLGIGLHSGPVIAGNIGNQYRKQYSLTGTTVNIASRIEQLNKKYESQYLISETVYPHIDKNLISTKSLGKIELRGIERPVEIFKPII